MRYVFLMASIAGVAMGTTYHVDGQLGNDGNDGLSPTSAWQTLEKAGGIMYVAGDRLLLKRGSSLKGKLQLQGARGTRDEPVLIDTYGSGGALPAIDSAGYIAGVVIEDCTSVIVRDLQVSSDGGKAIDARARTDRFGVVFTNNVYIRDALLPAGLAVEDGNPITGNPAFALPGGTTPQDYIPANTGLLRDGGISITAIPGDKIGLKMGLAVDRDFFGNPIIGRPDLGAVELTDNHGPRTGKNDQAKEQQ